jgi:hypothetical protein
VNRMLDAALKYLQEYHFSVIPCNKGTKKALIPWESYQKKLPNEEEIKKWWSDFPEAQVAIVTGIISGLCVVDADDAEAEKVVQEFFPDSLLMPTVRTPRGGKHYYFKCVDTQLTNKAGLKGYKLDFRANGGYVLAPPSSNGKGSPYTFLPKLSIKDVALPLLPKGMHLLLNNSFSSLGKCKESVRSHITGHNKTLQILTQGRRDNDLFHYANSLIKTKTPVEEVWQVLEILARNCQPPFPEKEIEEKIKSALKRVSNRERNLSQEVRNWVTLQKGYFSLTETCNSLQLFTKEEKNNLYVIIQRLENEALIEKYGKKSGIYRTIENTIEKIDFLNVSNETIDLHWPFKIESLVKTMPKNIIVLAGVSNSGKTAFLLNFVEMNMDRYDIHYFSSEMGGMELNARLAKFDRPLDSWHFTPYERTANYADVIKPDGINIIDYLEIYQEHYHIGQWIKDIYDKLNKGIAIIAIQKKPGAPYGVGGATTIEKARLYLSLDSGRLKIEKGKNWANEMVNPNKLSVQFKLVQGCKFIQRNDWEETRE